MKKNKKIFKKKKDGWYISKDYIHFDLPISQKNATKKVKSRDFVAKRAFFPLISFNIKSKKYVKQDDGTRSKKTKTREICYASHLDSHIYSYYAKELSISYEKMVEKLNIKDNVLAFRKIKKETENLTNIHFASIAFNKIRSFDNCSIIAIDFSDFFGTLDHEILKESIQDILGVTRLDADYFNIYKSLVNYTYVNKDDVYKLFNIPKNNTKGFNRICSIEDFRAKVRNTYGLINPNPKKKLKLNKGIPQGTPISALLSNIYMLNFDVKLKEFLDKTNSSYYRYCDDILIITPEMNTEKIEKEIYALIDKFKLDVNKDKTEYFRFEKKDENFTLLKKGITNNYNEGYLQYLGFLFNGNNIYLRTGSITKYDHKMKKALFVASKTREKINHKIRTKYNIPHDNRLYKKKLYRKFSSLGNLNFIKYAEKAKIVMCSDSIKKQIKHLNNNLLKEIKNQA